MRARALRQSQTDAEALMWSRLRDRRFMGLKFRRQRPIAGYIADFVCMELALVIELDGGQHNELPAATYDQTRADVMSTHGFQTLRFWNNDVLLQTDSVMEQILQTTQALTPALSR